MKTAGKHLNLITDRVTELTKRKRRAEEKTGIEESEEGEEEELREIEDTLRVEALKMCSHLKRRSKILSKKETNSREAESIVIVNYPPVKSQKYKNRTRTSGREDKWRTDFITNLYSSSCGGYDKENLENKIPYNELRQIKYNSNVNM